MAPSLADIALPVPLDRIFTYLVPPDLQDQIRLGSRVIVPFQHKKLTGVVVGFPEQSTIKSLKPITDLLDTSPSFSGEMLKLTKWIAEYYLSSWGEVLKAATPQGVGRESKRIIRLVDDKLEEALQATKGHARKQHAILLALQDQGPLSTLQLQKKIGVKSITAMLHAMQSQGWIGEAEALARPAIRIKHVKSISLTELGKEWISSAQNSEEGNSTRLMEKQRAILTELLSAPTPQPLEPLLKKLHTSASTIRVLESKMLLVITQQEVVRSGEHQPVEPPPLFELNSDQLNALQQISTAIDSMHYKTFLLHGITGSGKTQVYIDAIRKVIEKGKTAIVLVPEISLTPQTVRRFKSHFSNDVTVMHSQMSTGERFDAWRLAHEGRVKIVIGPRSAIFAPLANIGLIVVDEEHEASYKQFDAQPRYNARDVAIVRATLSNAVVILGSATPSTESYYNALNGKYEVLELPVRIDQAKLPKIEIVDMVKERKQMLAEKRKELKESAQPYPKQFPVSSLSKVLRAEITERIEKHEGVILLQNRRGFSHFMECFACGYVEKCDNCEVTLTFHSVKKHLRCHYCGFVKKPPTTCPICHSVELRFHSFGTQQVQEELQELFPALVILRMDRDTTTHKGAHDQLLSQFGNGKADILLGTQMVAKGLDFPRVTLVGVISADTQMMLPDFRSSERTFQLLTQVAGRAGRSTLEGEVVIQTYQPDHYSLKHVLIHDFRGFYREELEFRRELDYPPFSRIILIEFKGERENEVQHHAVKFAEFLTQQSTGKHFLILGPADAAISKVKNQFRKHIIIKNLKQADPTGAVFRAALLKAQDQYAHSALTSNRKIQMITDVDPQGMM
ncbi:MAG: primosomal protein N' [bacterium]